LKVLLINQHFHPEVASSGQIMTELCQDLVKSGCQVTALTGRASYRALEDQEVVQREKVHRSGREWTLVAGPILGFLGRLLPHRYLELDKDFGIDIIRTYTYSPRLREGRGRLVQRVVQYVTFFITSFIAAVLMPRHDVVIYLSTPPLLNGVTAVTLKWLKGSRLIYNIQDLYPDVAVKLGAVRNRVIIGICGVVEKILYKYSDAIVPVGEKIARRLREKGVPDRKISVIPNWMDTELVRPLGKETEFSRQHGLKDKFVVMYSGNIGLSQGLETILACAEKTEEDDIIYMLIGGGASKEYLVTMAEELTLTNLVFLPYQPKEKLSESLSAADVHLVPLKKGLSNYSLPSKVYGIMASARPIIASVDKDSEVAYMVERANCGLVVEPDDPVALEKAIMTLYNDRGKLNRLGRNGRAHLEKTNTRSVCTYKYMELIRKVAS